MDTAIVERPARAPRARTRPAKRRPRHSEWLLAAWRTSWFEALLVVGLFAFAMSMRWPYLLRLPHFTDEMNEIRQALGIWRGERYPLTVTPKSGYAGSLHAFIVAGCLWLFGPHMVLPRAIVCIVGALTVVATYGLGKALAGRGVGLLGAGLLATLPQHIVVNSHVAWQNSTTPFYSTVGLWALTRFVGGEGPKVAVAAGPVGDGRRTPAGAWLVLAGLCYGLALQTHVGVIVLAPAIVAVFLHALWLRKSWAALWRPWPWLAVVAAAIGYAPVILFNLWSGFVGVERARTSRDYAFETDPTWDSYRHNMVNLLLELARMISDPFRIPERRLHYLTTPYLPVLVVLCLFGLVVLARQRRPLPAFALVSTTLVMPYFNHAYGVEGDRYLVTGRYVAFLLPVLEIAVAAGALTIAGWLVALAPRRWHGLAVRDAARVVPAALLVVLTLYPLVPLRRYYTHEAALDPDNATFLETIAFINAHRGPRTPVLVDYAMFNINLKDGAEARDILSTLLTLDSVPHLVTRDPRGDLTRLGAAVDPTDTEALPIIVMLRDECWPLRDQVPLQRISGRLRLRELYWTLPSYYGVYRYAPPPQPAACLPASGPTPGD